VASRLGFVHLDGPLSGQTAWLPRLPATIGSDAEHDLVITGSAPRHAVVFERDGRVVLVDSGSPQGTLLAGHSIQEAVLCPGDVLELGEGGPRLQFHQEQRVAAAAPAVTATPPVSQTMVMRMVTRTSRNFWRAIAALVLVAGAVVGWLVAERRRMERQLAGLEQTLRDEARERRAFEQRVENERQRAVGLEQRLDEARRHAEDLRAKLVDAHAGQVQVLQDELGTTRERIATLETEQKAGEEIIRQYGAGVCLIQGSYAFYDAAGRPLRYRVDEDGEEVREPDGSPSIGPEESGGVHTVDYYGTGFLVQAGGLVLTNRHVAEPWWQDGNATALQKNGYQPRFVFLRAFFPRQREAFELKLHRRSETVDLALLRADLKGRQIPVLPLEQSKARVVPGQPVVVVGYPTGLEAIMAKAETNLVKSILESHGTDSTRVTEALSRQGLIRPSTTQGHIGDVTGSDIVFDAPSAQGGSGGPVFNKHGQVVAVEYAVLPKFGGNSFGVPISYALALIRETARKPSDD
jgi:S1-C subfamily serine protease